MSKVPKNQNQPFPNFRKWDFLRHICVIHYLSSLLEIMWGSKPNLKSYTSAAENIVFCSFWIKIRRWKKLRLILGNSNYLKTKWERILIFALIARAVAKEWLPHPANKNQRRAKEPVELKRPLCFSGWTIVGTMWGGGGWNGLLPIPPAAGRCFGQTVGGGGW